MIYVPFFDGTEWHTVYRIDDKAAPVSVMAGGTYEAHIDDAKMRNEAMANAVRELAIDRALRHA